MKTNTLNTFALIAFISISSLSAAHAGAADGDHADQNHSQVAGGGVASPHGGRVVTVVEPHFEFFLQADRIAQITFIDSAGAKLPVADQQISLMGGDRSAPVTLDFVEKDGVLVSEQALPEIKNMPIVLQIKATPGSKTVREKFYLNTSMCGSCSYQEYACICGH